MTYQVLYAREDGAKFAMEFHNETAKDSFVETLSRSGIDYEVIQRDEKKWRLCRVVFDLRDIEPAMKDPNYKYSYTFGDPEEFSKSAKVLKAKTSVGEIKPVFVVDAWSATETAIQELKLKLKNEGKLKTDHLSLIVGKVA